MKKLIICALAASAILAGTASASPYSATGVGTSTIGGAGSPDYATLKLACDAVITAGTRDATTWTFEIGGNLTEAANVYLSCNVTTGGKIIFKPAATVTPTVTFGGTRGATLFANFVIGVATEAYPLAASTGTSGIEFDGFNSGGTTRDLTFTHTAGDGGTNQALIALVGDADNIVFKNCNIINPTNNANAGVSAFGTRATLVSAVPYTADNWTIQNCSIDIPTAAGTGPSCIAVNTLIGTAPTNFGSNGFTIKDNVLTGRQRGIIYQYAYGYTVTGNSIRIGLNNAASGTTENFAMFCNGGSGTLPANVNTIANNRIYVRNTCDAAAPAGPTALSFNQFSTAITTELNIFNNEIVVVNVGARNSGVTGQLTRGIWMGNTGTTSRIYNNTIWIPKNANELGDPAATTQFFGIGNTSGTAYNMDIRGNVIVVEEANAVGIAQTTLPSGSGGSGFSSDYNVVYVPTGSVAKRTTTSYATLALYSAASGTDLNSDSFNPLSFFNNTTVSPTLTDLTLKSTPPTVYANDDWGIVPSAFNTSTVTTDYSGQARSATAPYRGFDEGNLPVAPTAVNDWMLLDTE